MLLWSVTTNLHMIMLFYEPSRISLFIALFRKCDVAANHHRGQLPSGSKCTLFARCLTAPAKSPTKFRHRYPTEVPANGPSYDSISARSAGSRTTLIDSVCNQRLPTITQLERIILTLVIGYPGKTSQSETTIR